MIAYKWAQANLELTVLRSKWVEDEIRLLLYRS